MRGEAVLDESLEDLGSLCRSGFRIGGVSVGVGARRDVDVVLSASLEPFRMEARVPDVDIQVEWLTDLPSIPNRQVFDSGCTWRLYESKAGFQFDFHVPALGVQPYKRLLIDPRFSEATLQMSEEAIASADYRVTPLTYPLDELLIMHRLTREKAIELHGTGIVRSNGEANLFVGHSGAGKSTTTRLWTAVEDVEVLSDDRIIVRRDEDASGVGETPFNAGESASTRGVLRLRDCSASRSNLSAQDDKGMGAASRSKYRMRMYGTPWHGEAMYASPNSSPLSRIFVLEHGHGNVITPLTPSQAVAELFARAFVPFHRHEYVESALTFLEEVVESVPVYRYSFEPDQRAVDTLLNFHD